MARHMAKKKTGVFNLGLSLSPFGTLYCTRTCLVS